MKATERSEERLREALTKIAKVANMAVENGGNEDNTSSFVAEDEAELADSSNAREVGCTLKSLPKRLHERASEVARMVNPINAPAFGLRAQLLRSQLAVQIYEPQALTVFTTKYWGPIPRKLTVSFMEETEPKLRARIISNMNAWANTGCISFVETSGVGKVRISRRGSGYWSYLGTDILLIPKNRPTMNLQGFSMETPESEFRRVVRHETGHTLGFPHEHMRRELVNRIDPEKAYRYFRTTQGWDKQTVDEQVLKPLDERTIIGTPADQTSIMCYQLPGSITRDGKPILGGRDINETDYKFVGTIYPKPGSYFAEETVISDTWDESEDVGDEQIAESILFSSSDMGIEETSQQLVEHPDGALD